MVLQNPLGVLDFLQADKKPTVICLYWEKRLQLDHSAV